MRGTGILTTVLEGAVKGLKKTENKIEVDRYN